MRLGLTGIKVSKSFSRETTCYRATVTLDGRRVGTVENDGRGGSDNVWVRPDSGVTHEALAEAAKADLLERGDRSGDDLVGLHPGLAVEIAFAHLLDEWEERATLKRLCKTRLVFRLPGDPKGQWRTLMSPYGPSTKAWVVAKYPGCEIANEREGVR